ncbi:gluconokinase [Actinomadura sp. NEAU-AAG7]|uniref:gluconokinase n=1 Tax=Actinomadura sp. NEAU-AAG7 TaxID=2839640 RepID=UPI0027E05FFF|nr:gluconokinase [Actinomadura sp. NEAU-AAG7]
MPPQIILIAGVSGSGKTTVGTLLAERLNWDYAEADTFHSPANIAKMSEGHPLTDEDRLPWLNAIAAWMDDRLKTGRPGVVTCSALKRSYRKLLTNGRPEVQIILLTGDRETLESRLKSRTGHFFNPTLLDTQLAALEPPTPTENIPTLPITKTPEELATQIIKRTAAKPRPT